MRIPTFAHGRRRRACRHVRRPQRCPRRGRVALVARSHLHYFRVASRTPLGRPRCAPCHVACASPLTRHAHTASAEGGLLSKWLRGSSAGEQTQPAPGTEPATEAANASADAGAASGEAAASLRKPRVKRDPQAKREPQAAPLKDGSGRRLRLQTPGRAPPPTTTFNARPGAAPSSADPLAEKPQQARGPMAHAAISSPKERAALFAARLQYVADRLGPKPAAGEASKLRSTAWAALLDISSSREDMEKIVALMPKWAASKRPWPASTVTQFLGRSLRRAHTRMPLTPRTDRCYQFKCADLALRVLNEPQTYGIAVPSLDAGADVICAAVRRSAPADARVLAGVVGLLGVMRVQRLPPPASALVPCAAFLRALVDPRMRTPASERVARALLPALRDALARAPPLPAGALDRAAPTRRWALTGGLAGVQAWMVAAGIRDARWLWDWRAQSGLLQKDEKPDRRMLPAGAVPPAAEQIQDILALTRQAAAAKGMFVSL
jgi:hypothetical protein